MALTFMQRDAILENDAFKTRVRIALVTGAQTVQAESAGTTNHAERSLYARAVLANPDQFVRAWTVALAAHSTFQAGADWVNETKIQQAVDALWNAFAV